MSAIILDPVTKKHFEKKYMFTKVEYVQKDFKDFIDLALNKN